MNYSSPLVPAHDEGERRQVESYFRPQPVVFKKLLRSLHVIFFSSRRSFILRFKPGFSRVQRTCFTFE